MSCITCHVSGVTCHVSHVFFSSSTKWLSLLVEGLLSTGPTLSSLCKCSFTLNFVLKFLATHLAMHCPNCLIHMDNCINPGGSVMVVERISRLSFKSQNINKKHLAVFGFPVQIILFQTSFTKSKTQTNDRFSHYCLHSALVLRPGRVMVLMCLSVCLFVCTHMNDP